MVEFCAIYVLWLREMKKFSRAWERIVGSVAMPLMFLLFLGFGFQQMTLPNLRGVNYINFLVPGMLGMNMLFGSMFSGISVLWDKEFGFLKEIMIAPVSRVSIVLGRVAGGASTGMIQGLILFCLSFLFGFMFGADFPLWRIGAGLVGMLVFMFLIALVFISLGLSFAANMRDAQGFELIINFVMFPLFFLSGAVSPIANLPAWLRIFSYLNPLTYGVDGLRYVLVGVSSFSPLLDIGVCLFSSVAMVALAAFFFERNDSV